MKLIEYLNKRNGLAETLAKSIGIPPALMSQWKTGARQVPAERCPLIERATGGMVTCEEMRPDVDWAYLRATGRQSCEDREAA